MMRAPTVASAGADVDADRLVVELAEATAAAAAEHVCTWVDVQYAVWTAQTEDDAAALGRQVGAMSVGSTGVESVALSEAGRLERLGVLDRLKGAVEAEQLRLLAGFYDSRVADDVDRQVRASDVGRTAALEVSLCRRVASQTAAAQIALAVTTVHDYPMTLDALAAGHLSLPAVRAIVGEGEVLTPGIRGRLDQVCVHDAITRDLTPGQTRLAARRRVLQLDPEAGHRRYALAREHRDVRYRALPDGVAELTLHTKAEQALGCLRSLEATAHRERAGGDQRSLAQLRADTLVDHVLGETTSHPRPVELQIVVTADTLADIAPDTLASGLAAEPALLCGYGPLPAAIACPIAHRDLRWLRKLLADPVDYHLTAASPRTRAYTGDARAFLSARDQTCAVETCERPGDHADHIIRHIDGGPTTGHQGRWLCASHNYAKEHPDVNVTIGPHDTTIWRLPSGNHYTNHPPPVLGHGTGDPPWQWLYQADAARVPDTG